MTLTQCTREPSLPLSGPWTPEDTHTYTRASTDTCVHTCVYTCAYTNACVLSEFSRGSAGYRHSAKHTDHVQRSPIPQDTVGDRCGALVDTGLCAGCRVLPCGLDTDTHRPGRALRGTLLTGTPFTSSLSRWATRFSSVAAPVDAAPGSIRAHGLSGGEQGRWGQTL